MFEKFDDKPMTFEYVTYKGIKSTRNVLPMEIVYGKLESVYSTPRWVLKAFDLDKHEVRYFDFDKINKE